MLKTSLKQEEKIYKWSEHTCNRRQNKTIDTGGEKLKCGQNTNITGGKNILKWLIFRGVSGYNFYSTLHEVIVS